MSERGFTRRSLLGAAAGVAAGGLARPGGALARAGAGVAAAGPWATPAAALGGLALIPPTLPAGPGQPPIVAREAWARGACLPRVAPAYGAVEMAFVHHTENPNGYRPADVPTMLRAIFLFHRDGRGWNDIGYNFVVDRFGRIFEARAGGIDEAVVGAQAGGYNYASTGVAVLGEYGAQRISPAARRALAHLLAWKLALHGVPLAGRVTVRVNPAGAVYSRFPAGAHVSLPRLAGHRDADSTSCPGDALYGELPGLRAAAERLAGRPASLTLAVLPAATGETGETAGVQGLGLLAGVLSHLGGTRSIPVPATPIPNAPIQIQARTVARHGELVRESTLVQTLTAADGTFTVPLAPAAAPGAPAPGPSPTPGAPQGPPPTPAPAGAHGAGGLWLRALCPGAPGVPAAVSAALHLSAAVPSTTPPGAPPAGPTPPPTPAPAASPTG